MDGLFDALGHGLHRVLAEATRQQPAPDGVIAAVHVEKRTEEIKTGIDRYIGGDELPAHSEHISVPAHLSDISVAGHRPKPRSGRQRRERSLLEERHRRLIPQDPIRDVTLAERSRVKPYVGEINLIQILSEHPRPPEAEATTNSQM
jgi:hypothetical protein